MTSPSPLLYDTYYHIYNRGVNYEDIFIEERNYSYFLQLYAKYVEPVAMTYAYCLLKNHFHVLIKVKTEDEIQTLRVSETLRVLPQVKIKDPSSQFSDLFNAYAKAINKANQRAGSLFQHPYGRIPVTSDAQFTTAIRYIHQNPQKHKFVEDFREWKYSSYHAFLSDLPTHLQRDAVLNWFGGKTQYLKLHTEWVADAKVRWLVEDD
jgi:putative transposase